MIAVVLADSPRPSKVISVVFSCENEFPKARTLARKRGVGMDEYL